VKRDWPGEGPASPLFPLAPPVRATQPLIFFAVSVDPHRGQGGASVSDSRLSLSNLAPQLRQTYS
jgi:hypothetical protein